MPHCGIAYRSARGTCYTVKTSKNRTSFRRETTMALSQRLEFRQSQALVMTPQLMQAIKLLQLSSLDLAAYVEGELEHNPLLERASDDENSTPGSRAGGRRRRARRAIRAARPTGSARISRPAAPRWSRGSAPSSRTSFPTTAGKKPRPPKCRRRPIRNGRASAPAAAGRRLQSRSLRVGRDHAGRSSRRADGAGDLRSGRAA